jgi:hypothetical protein
MVYVGDLVEGMIAAAESPSAAGQTYFLNHPEVLTTTQVIKTTAAAMDRPRGLTLPTPLWVLGLVAPLAELGYRYTPAPARPPPATRCTNCATATGWPTPPRPNATSAGKPGTTAGRHAPHHALLLRRAGQGPRHGLETQPWLWIKYVLVGIVLGILIEIASATGAFTPSIPAGWSSR